ncbi:MAG: hypothetical protein E4H20_07840 [Spirochaetales bacterium]|nr:MAG: hypothetical protein E4H20_07840 [Spirochaetales bacterium]
MEDMRRLGVDIDDAAAILDRLRDEGQKGLGEPITVDGQWVATTGDARGVLPCPWNDGVFHKNSIRIQDTAGADVAVFSDLSIHLLRTHRFCQGRGSPFRLSPEILAKLVAAE